MDALTDLGEACGISDLTMHDCGIEPGEFSTFGRNARMGVLSTFDPAELCPEEVADIFKKMSSQAFFQTLVKKNIRQKARFSVAVHLRKRLHR